MKYKKNTQPLGGACTLQLDGRILLIFFMHHNPCHFGIQNYKFFSENTKKISFLCSKN